MAKEKTMTYTSGAGNKFTFQKVNVADWLDIMDQSENPATGRPSHKKLNALVLEHVVVQPQLKFEDFDKEPYNGYGEMQEVTTAAVRFQQGQ